MSTPIDRKPIVLPPGFEDLALPEKRFSHSQYGLFKKCGMAYYFRYVEGLRMPPRGAMFKGTVVHKGAEFSLQSVVDGKGLPTLENALSVVADVFEAGKTDVDDWSDDEGEKTSAGKVKDTALAAYRVYHGAMPKMHPEAVEVGFAIKLGDVPVTGYIDQIDRVKDFDDAGDQGRQLVVDLKTTTKTWAQDAVDRAPQLTLYAAATGIPEVRVDCLVDLKAGPKLDQKTSVRGQRHLTVLTQDYADVTKQIKAGVFPMAPIDSWQCTSKWCGYYDMCRGKYK